VTGGLVIRLLCEHCRGPRKPGTVRYCSPACAHEGLRRSIEHTCARDGCGRSFLVRLSTLRHGQGRFCSRACAHAQGWPAESTARAIRPRQVEATQDRSQLERTRAVQLPPPLLAVPQYPTLAEAVERFLDSLRFAPARTAQTYRDGLRRFDHFLASAGVDSFTETAEVLPVDVLEHFFRWMADAGYRRTSIDVYLGGAKAFFRFAVHRRYVPPHFTYELIREGLRQAMGKPKRRSPRIDPRLPLIVTYVDNLPLPPVSQRAGVRRLEVLRDRALLHVLFYSGMRRAEVVSLNRQDVQDGWAHEALIVGKGDKERHVFFGDDAQAAIRAYLDARDDALEPLWLRHDNRRGPDSGNRGEQWRLSAQSVWGIVKAYGRLVGVEASTHHFRHLKASTLLNRGASLSEVQDVLGHADPGTTKQIYAHYTPQFLRQTVAKFSATPGELVDELEAEAARRRGSLA
jgi:site-specific recombinase XerD